MDPSASYLTLNIPMDAPPSTSWEPNPSWPPTPSRARRLLEVILSKAEVVLLILAVLVLLVLGGVYLWAPETDSTVDVQPVSSESVPGPAGLEPGTSSLAIYSFPDGATVILNDEEAGTTPLVLNNIADRTYRLTLRTEQYPAKDTLVTLTPETMTSLVLLLDEESEPMYAEPQASALPLDPPSLNPRRGLAADADARPVRASAGLAARQ